MIYNIYLTNLILLLMFFAGCKSDLDMSIVPNKQFEFTKAYLEVIRNRQFDKLDSVLAPNLKGIESKINFEIFDAVFPKDEKPKEILFIGSSHNVYPDSSTTEITFQYDFGNHFTLGDLFLVTKHDDIIIAGIHINPMGESLSKTNAFSLIDKTTIHYIFLFLILLLGLFISATFILCLKSDIKKKWLWAIFILIGFGKIVLNWTTGNISFSIISFQLFGFGITSPGRYAPWFIGLSIPLGAIIFLIKRKKLIESNKLIQEVI